MTPKVHILATCKNPELLPMTTLVFKTLRTGFPSADVDVHVNGMRLQEVTTLIREADSAGVRFVAGARDVHHHDWVRHLVETEKEPFWICDTDMVFYDSVEKFTIQPSFLMSGRHIPSFREEWTGLRHAERLHTCLLYLNPVEVCRFARDFRKHFPPGFPGDPALNLIRQNVQFRAGYETVFFDTCAGLYHACINYAHEFNEVENSAFAHLNCGTYSDKVELSVQLARRHRDVLNNPEEGRKFLAEERAYHKILA